MDNQSDIQEARFSTEETAVEAPPSLSLDVDDKKLIDFIDTYIKNAKTFYNEEKNLETRRERNKEYLFSKQLDDKELKSYEKKYVDNVIKEGEDMLRPLVLSRLPDLIVNPGIEGDESKQKVADAISDVINKKLTSRELKRVLAMAFRHHPVYFTGVIKYRWDPSKGRFGGVKWEAIHPENILVDHTATTNNEEDMRIVVHYVEKPIKEWIMMFPDKEQELKDFAREKGKVNAKAIAEDDEASLAVNLKIPEIWFDWFEKVEDFDPEEPEFDFKSGVCWKAGDNILAKRQNPNWDWDGEDEFFVNGQPIPEESLAQIAAFGFDVPGIERKTVFRNFFGRPRKPFIFLGYEQWGEMPLDETSRIEQNILLQQNYDTRGMQITKMIDDSRGKHVFSTQSGLRKETIEQMDLNDPDEDVVVEGDLRAVHAFIKKEQPSEAMFADLARTRERMLAKVNVHASTRGEIESDTATTNQISREADFTVADDLAEDTINDAAIQMAEAMLHMMKLRYTPDHFKAVLGDQADIVHDRLTNDIIDDGFEVDIFASGTDKLKAERMAKEEAQLGLIDPLTYFKEVGRSDPEGRAEKMFLFNTAPNLWFEKFVQNREIQDTAEKVMAQNQQNMQQAGAQGQQTPGERLQPSPQDTTQTPTTPQGSPRSLMGRAGDALGNLFNR